MKKITLTTLLFLLSLSCFAQDTEAPSVPTNVAIDYQIGYLGWTSSTDNVAVTEYDVYVNDVFRLTINHHPNTGNGIILNDLEPFNYGEVHTFKVLARDAAGNESTFSNYASFIADAPGDSYFPNHAFISRVMNGDNDNKVIEILNINDFNFDITGFSLKISHDGNSTWDTTYMVPAEIIPGSYGKIRIANSQAMACPFETHNAINDVITNFDGNDAIGLFYNDVLIDRLGNLGENTTYIGANEMGFRPYYVDQHTPWTVQPITEYFNICEGFLGEEYYLLSTPEVTAKTIAVYPNPVKGNLLHFETKNNQAINFATIFDITGKTVLTSARIIDNQLNIQNITQGVYFVKIQSGNKVSIHKMIRQ